MAQPSAAPSLSEPTFTQADHDFEVYYPAELLRFRLEAVNETATGMVHAEITVTSDRPDLLGRELAWDRVQLNSRNGREKLALAITQAYQGEDIKKATARYVTMLHEVSRGVTNRLRHGEEIETITNPQRRQRDAYLLRPLVMEGQVNGIYGDGDVGKGFVALSCMIALLNGGLPIGMPGHRIGRALYVDYETDRSEIEDRVARICDGMGIERVAFDYRRAGLPIQQEVRAIRRQMRAWDLVIWDSMGAGMTELANDPGVAASCVNALRTFETTVLFLDHTNKSGAQIGSVYKRNLCRNLWLAQKRVDLERGSHTVTMYAKKGNNVGQRSAIGLDFFFDGDDGTVRVAAAGRLPQEAGAPGRPRVYASDADRKKAWAEKRSKLRIIDREGDDGPE